MTRNTPENIRADEMKAEAERKGNHDSVHDPEATPTSQKDDSSTCRGWMSSRRGRRESKSSGAETHSASAEQGRWEEGRRKRR